MTLHHGRVAWSLACLCGISDGQSGIQTGSASSTSVFPLSCHSTNVPLLLSFVYTMYLKCWDKLQEWVPHTKQGNKPYRYMSANSWFLRYSPHVHHISIFLELYLWGHIKFVVYSAPIQNDEQSIFHRTFMPVTPFATAAEPLKGCDSPWTDVPVHSLI